MRAFCKFGANLQVQGSFPLIGWQGRKRGRMVLKAAFYFLTAQRIKFPLDGGQDGAWVTPNRSEALVFASLIHTGVTEKNI